LFRKPPTRSTIPPLAETQAVLAEFRVQRRQSAIDGGDHDALIARPRVRDLGITPVRHAAADPVAEASLALHLQVARPELPAGHRVQRDHLAERRRQVHAAVDDQRRGFERGGIAGLDAGLAGLVFPGELEPADVVAVDLRQR
jgi:hypothetical protein